MIKDARLPDNANQVTQSTITKFLRIGLLGFGNLGTTLFGSAFVMSVLNPDYVEGIAKDIIRQQVEKKVHEKIDALGENFIVGMASHMIKGMQRQADDAKRDL